MKRLAVLGFTSGGLSLFIALLANLYARKAIETGLGATPIYATAQLVSLVLAGIGVILIAVGIAGAVKK